MDFKKVALGAGLALLLPMIIFYGVSTFVSEPKMLAWNEQKKLSDSDQLEVKAKYEALSMRHNRILYFVSMAVGIPAIAIGAFVPMQAIGSGLMFGGIFSIIHGYVGYWEHIPHGLRFISLLIAFCLLLFVGVKKLY
jgi:hypothetical protein